MRRTVVIVFVVLATFVGSAEAAFVRPVAADVVLQAALKRFVTVEGASPGIAVVVHRGPQVTLHTAGVADVQTRRPIDIDDHMRLASVAKAFSGAAALSVVSDGLLSLDTTIGSRRPDLPAAWSAITLRQLLNHTSGISDFSKSPAFQQALFASLKVAPPPRQLLSFVENLPLDFAPGSRYVYSNSDNIVVGLMVESATGKPYEEVLAQRVYGPLGLTRTSLPRGVDIPSPVIRGYDAESLTDLTTFFAAGWAWASGGLVSTPRDAERFVRAYAAGVGISPAVRAEQFQFVDGGSSEPPGPGVNAAGLAIFRYQTSCGTVYGHTGNTAGYTQFIGGTPDGSRSVTVSVNAQITPTSDLRAFLELRQIYTFAVCAALAPT